MPADARAWLGREESCSSLRAAPVVRGRHRRLLWAPPAEPSGPPDQKKRPSGAFGKAYRRTTTRQKRDGRSSDPWRSATGSDGAHRAGAVAAQAEPLLEAVPGLRRGTSTRRLNSATRTPSWLSTRVWTLTVPRSDFDCDSRFSSTSDSQKRVSPWKTGAGCLSSSVARLA